MRTYLKILAIFSLSSTLSCSDQIDEENISKDRKSLPFTVKIDNSELNEDNAASTRVYFHGTNTSGTQRLLSWKEDDPILLYSTGFTKGTQEKCFIHIDGENVSLYSNTGVNWWASGSNKIRGIYPPKAFVSATGNDITAVIPTTQTATVDSVYSTSNKKYCPTGQEGPYWSYNVTDYNACVLYCGTSVTTSNSIPSNATLTFNVCTKAIDVIVDAPSEGSATINSVKVEVGNSTDTKVDSPIPVTGQITTKFTDGSVSSDQKHVDGKTETYALMNGFTPVKLEGNKRMVGRVYLTRACGLSSVINNHNIKITINCTRKNGKNTNTKDFVNILKTNDGNSDYVIKHFYLGPVPQIAYIE